MTPRYYLEETILLLQLPMTTITTSHDYNYNFPWLQSHFFIEFDPWTLSNFFPKFLSIVSPFLEIISSAYFVFLYHFT